jgi:WD40 repeat protein
MKRPQIKYVFFAAIPMLLFCVARNIESWRPHIVGQHQRFNNLDGAIYSLSFSSDGKRLVSCRLGEVSVWDVDRRNLVWSEVERTSVASVAFSPEGRYLATSDFAINLRDAQTGKLLKRFQDVDTSRNNSAVTKLVFSPNGKYLASISFVGLSPQEIRAAGHKFIQIPTVKVWDVTTGRVVRKYFGQGQNIKALRFSPDSTVLICGIDQRIKGEPITKVVKFSLFSNQQNSVAMQQCGFVKGMAMSDDLTLLAGFDVSSKTKTYMQLWNMQTGQKLDVPNRIAFGPTDSLTSDFSAHGKLASLIRYFNIKNSLPATKIVFWDQQGRMARTLENADKQSEEITSIQFSPGGNTLATGSTKGFITLWRVE